MADTEIKSWNLMSSDIYNIMWFKTTQEPPWSASHIGIYLAEELTGQGIIRLHFMWKVYYNTDWSEFKTWP